MTELKVYKNDLLRKCSTVKDNFIQFSASVRLSNKLDLKKVYIPLQLENIHLPKSVFDEDYFALQSRIKKIDCWIADFLDNPSLSARENTLSPKQTAPENTYTAGKRILLIAEPGAGKSTFVNRLCMAYLNYSKDLNEQQFIAALKVEEQSVFSNTALLPIMLTAKSLSMINTEEMQQDFLSIAYQCFRQSFDSDLTESAFGILLKESAQNENLIIFIDGIDELFQPEKKTLLLNALGSFLNEYPQCDILVTSRLLNRFPNQFRDYKTLGIQHLDETSIATFCKQWCSLVFDDSANSEEITKSITHSNDETIRQLRRLPLTLSHLLTVLGMEDGLPSNKAVLYERICQWYIRWNNRKQNNTLLTSTITGLLAYIAFAFTSRGWFSCTVEQLHRLVYDAIKDLQYVFEEQLTENNIEEYMRQLSNLAFFGRVGNTFSFLMHRQIQEYLTALAIKKEYLDKRSQSLKQNGIFSDKYSDSFWHEIIVFFILITDYREIRDSIINDIILLYQEDNDNSAYESLLLDILSNNVRSAKINMILDALFSVSINPQKIHFLYQLTCSNGVIFHETNEYLTARLQSDIQNNTITQEGYRFGIGYAVGIIKAGELMHKGINPLVYAEQTLRSENTTEVFLAKMILIIMLWTKCNDILTPFYSCISEYSFHSLPALRKSIKTAKNDFAFADMLQELILSDTINARELFDKTTTGAFVASLKDNESLTKAQIHILSVIPFESLSSTTLSLSKESQDALYASLELAETKNDLRELIYLFSACYDAHCFKNDLTVSNRFTTIVKSYVSSGLSEQENLILKLKRHIPLLQHYTTPEGEHFAATYFGNLEEANPKTFVAGRNNLAYCLRRQEFEAVYLLNANYSEARQLSVYDLLKGDIAKNSPFALINYALSLSNVHQNDFGDIHIGQTYLQEHPIYDHSNLTKAIKWWKGLADKPEAEGEIVLSWLYHSGYEEIMAKTLSRSDILVASSSLSRLNKHRDADFEKENTFTIINDNGEEVECEILFTFEHHNKNYIVYTNNEKDEENNTTVFASVFDPTQENPVLHPVETEEEWEHIEKLLEEFD